MRACPLKSVLSMIVFDDDSWPGLVQPEYPVTKGTCSFIKDGFAVCYCHLIIRLNKWDKGTLALNLVFLQALPERISGSLGQTSQENPCSRRNRQWDKSCITISHGKRATHLSRQTDLGRHTIREGEAGGCCLGKSCNPPTWADTECTGRTWRGVAAPQTVPLSSLEVRSASHWLGRTRRGQGAGVPPTESEKTSHDNNDSGINNKIWWKLYIYNNL